MRALLTVTQGTTLPSPRRRTAYLRVGRLHRMLVGQLLRRVGLHPGQELLMMQLWDIPKKVA